MKQGKRFKYKYSPDSEGIRLSQTALIFLIILPLAAGLLISYAFFQNSCPEKIKYMDRYIEVNKSSGNSDASESISLILAEARKVKLTLPAVDDKGSGVATDLSVEIMPGKGRILTNIDKLLFWVDTQQSIQTAKEVAEKITGKSTKNLDIIYAINAGEANLVGGPSAGAALALATIFILKNETPKSDVIITGTINADGTIGPVGGVLEKAAAAKAIGAKTFLVPKGEGVQVFVKPIENCKKAPGFVYCETTYQRIEVNIGESIGIEVKEVANVEEAAKYFK